MKKKSLLFLILFVMISINVQAGDHQSIQGLLDKFIADKSSPGIAVAILKKGEKNPVTYSAGVMDKDTKNPFEADTRIKIGSTTKVFTAIRIRGLIEEGKLDYSTPLSTFFPDYKNGAEITIENLLTHSSGIHEMLMVEPFHSHMDSSFTPDDVWKMVAPLNLDFEPGTKVKYSNTNFLMLGLIVEKITGNTYNSEIQSFIMDALGMKKSMPATDDLSMKDLASGYASGGPSPFKASLIPPQATGGIISTAIDLVKLVNATELLKNDPLNSNVRTVTLKNGFLGAFKVDAPGLVSEQGYGIGWEIDYYFEPSVRIIGKLGQFPGYCSGFYYWPDTKTAVAICTNDENAAIAVMNLAKTILVDFTE